jgi:Tfp pilus assembly protein FimT
VELLITLLVIMIMAAAALPVAQSSLTQFRLKSAVTSLTGAIQSTRFQAISNGYQYKIALNNTNRTYQISSDPTGSGTFTNVGGAVPYGSTSVPVNMGSDVVMQMSPSGKVTFVTGSSPLVFTLKNRTGTVTVSTYGNLSVKYGS